MFSFIYLWESCRHDSKYIRGSLHRRTTTPFHAHTVRPNEVFRVHHTAQVRLEEVTHIDGEWVDFRHPQVLLHIWRRGPAPVLPSSPFSREIRTEDTIAGGGGGVLGEGTKSLHLVTEQEVVLITRTEHAHFRSLHLRGIETKFFFRAKMTAKYLGQIWPLETN